MGFSIFIELCNHLYSQLSITFITSKRNPYPSAVTQSFLSFRPLLLSFLSLLDVSTLDISHKWSHVMCCFSDWLLWLKMFSRFIHIVVCTSTTFLFYSQITVHWMDILYCIYPFFNGWPFWLFPHFGCQE